MTVSPHQAETIKDQPLESQQATDASAKLSNQLSYSDYKTVFPTAQKGSAEPTTLDFGTADLYKTGDSKTTAGLITDGTPIPGTTKGLFSLPNDGAAPIGTAKGLLTPLSDASAPIGTAKSLFSQPGDAVTPFTVGKVVPTQPGDTVAPLSTAKGIVTPTSDSAVPTPAQNGATQPSDAPAPAPATKATANPSSDAAAPALTGKTGSVTSDNLAALNNKITTDTTKLTADEKALQGSYKDADKNNAGSSYQKALTQLNTDENGLRTDVIGFKQASEKGSNYTDFAATLDTHQAALKQVADGLDKMGLKSKAGETTAYFPTTKYEHEFSNSGSGGGGTGGGGGGTGGDGGGGGNPKGAQTFSNLEGGSWHQNTKDKGADSIGGSGDNPAIQTSYKDGVLTYNSTGGPGADTLISNKSVFKQGDNTFTLNYSMNRSAATAGNEQASEHDMVITGSNGYQAQAASQFNYNEKAPAGYTWFQTNNMATGKWENAALVPTPKPGEYTNVSMTVTTNPDNTYHYSNLTINGKSYALNPEQSTYSMEKENWTKNSAIVQFQEDLNKNGGEISQQYKDVSLVASYVPPSDNSN